MNLMNIYDLSDCNLVKVMNHQFMNDYLSVPHGLPLDAL